MKELFCADLPFSHFFEPKHNDALHCFCGHNSNKVIVRWVRVRGYATTARKRLLTNPLERIWGFTVPIAQQSVIQAGWDDTLSCTDQYKQMLQQRIRRMLVALLLSFNTDVELWNNPEIDKWSRGALWA
jgi:hypothetical protein